MFLRLNGALALVAILGGAGPALARQHGAPAAGHAASSQPRLVRPETDENLEWAASVVQVDLLRHQGNLTVKLFGAAGGDPAMNGLNTYIAFFDSPQDGWRIFRVGDFLSYRILSEAPGRVRLEIAESVMNERTGEIGSRVRRLALSWTAGRGDGRPESVNIANVR